VGNHLLAVSFSDRNSGMAVGGGGTILKTTDGGETWIELSGVTNSRLEGVAWIDGEQGTIVGYGGAILRTN
jgi:photosystem II stability/assembly factor-like uncharacterized protein